MIRFTIIILAFFLIIQSLVEEHILVYAHEGGEARHNSLVYRGDHDSSKPYLKDLYDAPRKLRSRRPTRVPKMNNDYWSFKVSSESKHLMVNRKLGFHKRSKSSSSKWKRKKKNPNGPFFAFYDDYRGPARHPPRHNL